ncbi:uncharacterized protein N7487_000304 [Penicillium crustosum]|uniref:uncharacterized protein n=1 Tax=Penicillium crustosum TaxID=36656 RepID=UPI00238D63FA|nr:uncharacterized protein N7487_000304 [Penicillium crustosum]KAJ5416754.1 hypothetical protein N7487_000304 [Penicillium crustosum]
MSDTDAEVCSQHLEALAIKRLRREFRSSCFGDIISTTGISRSIAGLLYNIGRLGQLRSAALEFGDQNHWFWEASEADLDGLELQLDQILLGRNNLEKAFETSVNRLNHIEGQYNDDELQHTIDLNRYNDALVHCARIALLERVKCVNAEDERISASTQRVFNLCSLIHDSSHTAKLLVLPLYMVGMRDKTPETRSFVRSRLQSLDDIIVTDTRALLGILEERWAISMGPEISPPNKGYAFEVTKGERFRIVDIHGLQIAGFMAWVNEPGLREHVRMSYTRFRLQGVSPDIGEHLRTNHDTPALTITADTCKVHDMTFMPCFPEIYAECGLEGHRSCTMNITEAMEPYGITSRLKLPDPFNIFMNSLFVHTKR